MEKVFLIIVKVTNWDKTTNDSRLEFNIKGNNINNYVVNSIRRTILNDIPIYAFDNIKINKNTSTFNNNYLKLRLNNLPVFGIENKMDIYEEEIKVKKETFDEQMGIVNYDDVDLTVDEKVNSSSLNQLTMYLQYTNETNDIVTVTTKDAKFYYKEKQIKSPYQPDIPLIKLNPKKEIILTAVSKLGIEEKSSIYSPVSVCYYKEKTDNDYQFVLESRGQINEKRIILVALLNLKKQLDDFLNLIPENKNMEGKLVLQDNDHTLGTIIANGMRKHSAVSFAGYNMPHPLDKIVEIHYKLNSGSLKKVLKDVVNYYKAVYNNIEKEINQI